MENEFQLRSLHIFGLYTLTDDAGNLPCFLHEILGGPSTITGSMHSSLSVLPADTARSYVILVCHAHPGAGLG